MTSTSLTLPGSSGLPLLGETPSFIQNMQSFIESRLQTYGPVFRTHLLRLPTLMSCSYSATVKLLHVDASLAYQEFMATLYPKPNLLLSPSQSAPRRIFHEFFLPALLPDALPTYIPSLRRHISDAFDELGVRASIRPYAFFKPLHEKVLSKVVFGDISPDLHVKLRALSSAHFNAVVAPPIKVEIFGRRSAHARGVYSYNSLYDLLFELVAPRLKTPRADGDSVLDVIVNHLHKHNAVSDDVHEQLVQFLLLLLSPAIAKSLASASASLTRQLCERKLRDQLLHNKDAVLMETLRLYPPLVGGMRLVRDTTLLGFKLTGEWRAWFSLQHANRDESEYERATEFLPARWAKRGGLGCPFARGGEESVPLSFGAGERHCPGRDLAWEILRAVCDELGKFEVRGGSGGAVRVLPVLREVRESEVVLVRVGDGD